MPDHPSAEAPDRRPSVWHRPTWGLNLVLVVLLLLTYLSVRISPIHFWPAAFLGILYPYTVLANVLCIGYWVLFHRRRMWPSLLAIALGWGHLGNYVRLFGNTTAPASTGNNEAFRVMSWNVRLFDLYNWSGNKRSRDEMLDLLATEAPQVLCLQEFYRNDQPGFFNTRDTLRDHFQWTGLHEEYTQHKGTQHFGIATLSTFPIAARGVIQFPGNLNNLCIWTDLVIAPDTVRIYNAHVASLRFGDADYRFIEGLDADVERDSLASAGRRILQRLRSGFLRRAPEVEVIAAHMRESPHPVVFCGDLNDTPMSYSYRTLCGPLRDAFVESGRGIGHTYIGTFPSFRIDHILHDARITSWSFRTLPDALSDHRPITCVMRVEN